MRPVLTSPPVDRDAGGRVPDDLDPSDFFRGESWRLRFDEEVLQLARSLAPKVRDLELGEPEGGSFRLTGRVAGGQETSVEFWADGSSWDCDASCDCGSGSFCVHAAALLLRASRERQIPRLGSNSAAAAVAATLARPTPSAIAPPPGLPRIAPVPVFELHVTREPADRTLKLLLQSLGQPPADSWIAAEAVVIYDVHRSPLRASMPGWTSRVVLPDGREALLEHSAAAETAAGFPIPRAFRSMPSGTSSAASGRRSLSHSAGV